MRGQGKTIDLMHDPRLPAWLRREIQAVSFEAECLDGAGVSREDKSPAGRRMGELYEESARLARASLPYLFGNVPTKPSFSDAGPIESPLENPFPERHQRRAQEAARAAREPRPAQASSGALAACLGGVCIFLVGVFAFALVR